MFQSMRSKMILVMLAVTSFTAALITVMFYQRSAEMIEDNYTDNLNARIRQTGSALDESLKEIYYLTVQAACDGQILEETLSCLSGEGEESLSELAELLRDYSGRNSDVNAVCLVIPGEQVIVSSLEYPVYQKDVPEEKLWEIGQIGSTPLTPRLMKDPLQESANILVFASPVETDEGRICAYVMCNIEERSLYYKYLDSLEDGETARAALLDEEGRIVSMRNTAGIGRNCESEYLTAKEELIRVQYQTDFLGYSFYLEREKSEVLADLRAVRFFLAVILLVVLSIAVILMLLIARAMYRPLKNLTEAMELVSGGELEQRVRVTTRDEIGRLSGEFNEMLDHIESLIGQVVQEEMLKKDAELEALQYQITPHFLYNTLNSIKYAALLRGENEIGGLLEDFIELLEASINKKGKFVTVAEEIHFVRNYMNLQQIRYEEEIVAEYQIPQEIEGCFLPRLMLQPLVENALLHGLDIKRGQNRIVIGGNIEEGRLTLWVQDNGRGMSKEQIGQLLSGGGKKERGLSGIGVANVRERLKLYYGERGGVACVSGDEGTRISMFLPAYREQDRYALSSQSIFADLSVKS